MLTINTLGVCQPPLSFSKKEVQTLTNSLSNYAKYPLIVTVHSNLYLIYQHYFNVIIYLLIPFIIFLFF